MLSAKAKKSTDVPVKMMGVALKDWLQIVCKENTYRGEIGLPTETLLVNRMKSPTNKKHTHTTKRQRDKETKRQREKEKEKEREKREYIATQRSKTQRIITQRNATTTPIFKRSRRSNRKRKCR